MVLDKLLNKYSFLTFASFFILNSFLDPSVLDKAKINPAKKELKIERLILPQRDTKKLRNIEVNVALDGVSRKYAQELLNEVSERYSKEFNISFKAVDFYNHKLPETWRTDLEMEKIKNKSRRRSDVYLLFSSRDWDNQDYLGSDPITGEAQDNLGYAWVETHNKKSDLENLIHEITHLFGVNHTNLEDSFMHRQNSGKIYFTEDMKNTIFSNKFKTWEFSKYIPK